MDQELEFQRRVSVQTHDTFTPPYDFNRIVEEIKSQRVAGEILVSFPGNGGITSVVFKNKPKLTIVEDETEEIAETTTKTGL